MPNIRKSNYKTYTKTIFSVLEKLFGKLAASKVIVCYSTWGQNEEWWNYELKNRFQIWFDSRWKQKTLNNLNFKVQINMENSVHLRLVFHENHQQYVIQWNWNSKIKVSNGIEILQDYKQFHLKQFCEVKMLKS